ncbi:hypothetical protein PoB_002526300 [Plakobranchus ocellatus]|uniref:Secreted protein n=1 Tax=Plakobranchus ocellatus TaxID=259542 RepID=A0AAV3ZWF5_9GAST|nr:hypothetical protein PoB_002526300 [Plakobranchus ocellatus]
MGILDSLPQWGLGPVSGLNLWLLISGLSCARKSTRSAIEGRIFPTSALRFRNDHGLLASIIEDITQRSACSFIQAAAVMVVFTAYHTSA